MEIICLNCSKKFEAQRKSAKFCSDTCRATYAKKLAKETGTKTGADPLATEKSAQINTEPPKIDEHTQNLLDLGKRTEAFLSANKATEEAFFEWADFNWGKPQKKEKKETTQTDEAPNPSDKLAWGRWLKEQRHKSN